MAQRPEDRNAITIRELQQKLARLERDLLSIKAGGSGSGSFNPQQQSVRIEDTTNFSAYINQDVKDTADPTFNSLTLTTPLADDNVADDITLTNITQITNRSHTDLSDIGTNTHPQIDTHVANEPSTSIATHAAIAAAHHTKYTDAEAIAAAVDDTAYAASWNGDTTHAPSKNAIYDKIEAVTATTTNYIVLGYSEICQLRRQNSTGVYFSPNTTTTNAVSTTMPQDHYLLGINLPHGAVVTGWDCYGGATSTNNFIKLVRYTQQSLGTASVMASVQITNTQVLRSTTSITNPTIDNNTYFYGLDYDCSTAAGTPSANIQYIKITYTI